MPVVSLEDAVALLYIERNQDQNDPIIDRLREGLSPEARRIADGETAAKTGSTESCPPEQASPRK